MTLSDVIDALRLALALYCLIAAGVCLRLEWELFKIGKDGREK